MYKVSFIILLSVLFTTSCTTVKPWQRGYLAKDVMASPQDSLRNSLDNHIYFSKEGSSGGGQAAGGGCGCN
ncbi:MAG: hypothetical protein ACI9DG_002215 [Oleispira sp.]|jgi:hypothetical protein